MGRNNVGMIAAPLGVNRPVPDSWAKDATGTLRDVAAGEQVLGHGQPPSAGHPMGHTRAADRLRLAPDNEPPEPIHRPLTPSGHASHRLGCCRQFPFASLTPRRAIDARVRGLTQQLRMAGQGKEAGP